MYSVTLEPSSRYHVRIRPNGTVFFNGMQGADGILASSNMHTFAVRVPGQKYWAARGEQGYAPASIDVYVWQDVPTKETDGSITGWVHEIASIPARGNDADAEKVYLTMSVSPRLNRT